jgi:decaprenyl-phosphate phosphoribosyltransferase
MQLLVNLLDVFRPKRWYRNVFLLLGTLIALRLLHISWGTFFSAPYLTRFALAFIALCLVASANYGINEVADAESDSHHPQKMHRAIPAGRVSPGLVVVISIVLYVIGMALVAVTGNVALILSLLLLVVSGIIYNVRPIRLKDRAYVDNPIRFMVGWYAVASVSQLVPASFLLGYWFIGLFLMAGKRFAEIRLITDRKQAARYRLSLGHYDEEHLLMSMIGAVAAFSFMLGALCMKYTVDIVVVLPFIIAWIIWFFKLAFEENSIVKDPERIFERKGFLAFSLLTAILFIYFFYSGNQFFNWIK